MVSLVHREYRLHLQKVADYSYKSERTREAWITLYADGVQRSIWVSGDRSSGGRIAVTACSHGGSDDNANRIVLTRGGSHLCYPLSATYSTGPWDPSVAWTEYELYYEAILTIQGVGEGFVDFVLGERSGC